MTVTIDWWSTSIDCTKSLLPWSESVSLSDTTDLPTPATLPTQATPADDCLWHSTHYAFIDAEARLHRLVPETIHRSEDEHPPTPTTSEPIALPEIELVPVINDNHSASSNAEPTTSTPRKKKNKKKKQSNQTGQTEEVPVQATVEAAAPEISPVIEPVSLVSDPIDQASELITATAELTTVNDVEEDPPAAKKKRNKHKKQKKETPSVSIVVEEEITEQPSPPPLSVSPKMSPVVHDKPEEEQANDDDDEGFQLVRHRKPPTPAAQSKPKPKPNNKRDPKPKPATDHGHQRPAIPSSPPKEEQYQPQPSLNESPPSIEQTDSLITLSSIPIDPPTSVLIEDESRVVDDTAHPIPPVTSESLPLSEVAPATTDVPSSSVSQIDGEQTNLLVSTKMKKKRKKKPSAAAQPQQPTSEVLTPLSPPPTVITSNQSASIGTNQVSSKLDIFLPEYIRQQINSAESSVSSSVTSSPIIPKRKNRSNMLDKDLLTNELDPPVVSNISTAHSHGFRLWFQESHALSQQPASTQTMQQLVLQPAESDDEDGDDLARSSYATGTHQEKRMHARHGYCINHPDSFSTEPMREQHSPEDPSRSASHQHDQNSPGKQTRDRNSTASSKSKQQKTQHCAGDLFSNHLSINYDEWAHFIDNRIASDQFSSSVSDFNLLPSMDCFYARALDDDTYVSAALPISRQQRYGDFALSNEDSLVPRSCHHPDEQTTRRLKPSESFQRWRRPQLPSTDYSINDEVFVSHSDNGLSRRVKQWTR